MSKRNRCQLNVELVDPDLYDQLNALSENVGMSKRAIIEDLLRQFIGKARDQSPELLIPKSKALGSLDAIVAYRKISEPEMV